MAGRARRLLKMELLMNSIPAVEAVTINRRLPFEGGEVAVLRDVSLRVSPGEWVALVGPSGSGKSTLLGIIAGLDTPDAGRIVVDGVDITALGERELAGVRGERIGVVFQAYNLIPGLTAEENVEVPLYAARRPGAMARRAAELLDMVGLGDRRGHRPSQLSGGQQQRVAIARALVNRPSLLVADEPTGNLDRAAGAMVLDLFARLRAELGLTLVIATHDPAVAARADRVVRLADGQIVAERLRGGAQ
jgi:putative ABC transport system ATP-binding protein